MILKECICKSTEVHQGKYNKNQIEYGQCIKCNTLRQLQSINLEEVYKQYETEIPVRDSQQFENNLKRTVSGLWKKLDFYYWNIMSNPNKKNLLDVGCACGVFLHHAKTMGLNWECYGMDINQKAIDVANKKFGLQRALQGEFLQINYSENMFHLITLQEVIEHLINPIEYLEKIYKLLKPEGIVQITTPFFDNLIDWRNWEMLRLDHFWIFSCDAITNKLTEIGFKSIIVEDISSIAYENCMMFLAMK